MNTLFETLHATLDGYPRPDDLSVARVTKLVYLADWLHAIERDCQITYIQWHFDNFGPFVWDVKNCARDHPDTFAIQNTNTPFGTPKTTITLKQSKRSAHLDREKTRIINSVRKKTSKKTWAEFIRTIYSTYPIVTSDQYTDLDLVEKAREYRATKGEQ